MPLSTLVEQASAAPPLPLSEPTKGKPPPPPPKEEPPAPPLPPEEAKVIKYNEDVVICSDLKLNFVLTRTLQMRTGFGFLTCVRYCKKSDDLLRIMLCDQLFFFLVQTMILKGLKTATDV